MFVCSECGASAPAPGRCPADGTTLSPIGDDVLLGQTIGAYRVARLLGIGGMGRVYKAVHPMIGSRVAIKVLSRECSDRPELVERFFAEARAVNLIKHESIVNVLDLNVLPDRRPYIVMEYLDGAPLAAIIEHHVQTATPLPLGGIARLTAEVLDALAAAHAKGIIHRDLKPDNIFVTPSGRPKVLDFGIAKLTDVNNASTRTGSLLGTPHYMSPEQAAGRAVDHRADIYAIGVILFECTTGTKPFVADSLFELLRKHIESPPPSPRAFRRDMPIELEHVIMTALAKPPEQRFSTAIAMSMALQHATQQLSPEQWQPITGSGSGRPPSSGGWAPTPPASWGGAHGPTQPSPGNASTVSAGQVAGSQTKKSSKKGLAIGIVAALVIGGGVTAAVVASSGKTAGSGSGSDVAAGPTTPAPAPTPAPPAPAPEKKPDETPDPDEPDVDQALADIDDQLKQLPPDQRKQIEDQIKNLPPDARKQVQDAMRHAKKLQDGMKQHPGAPPPAEAPDTPAPAPKSTWIDTHDIDSPPGFDPERLDVTSFVAWAVQQAKKEIPDATLIRIDTNGVGPDGKANLKLASLASDHGSIDVRFISPSRSKRDPKLPIGAAQHDFKCEFRVMAEPDGVKVMPIDFADCTKEKPVPMPRCSFPAVWKKAIARKAPSQNAVGNVDYRSNGSKPVWYFDIGFGFDVVFSEMFDDGC